MARDDDDVVYIDISARADEQAADEASRKLRDRLKDGTKGIGRSIGDAMKAAPNGRRRLARCRIRLRHSYAAAYTIFVR